MSDVIERLKKRIEARKWKITDDAFVPELIGMQYANNMNDWCLEIIDEELAKEPQEQPTVNTWIPCSERLPEDLNDKNIDCFLVTDGFLIWMAYYNSEIGWQFAECTNSRNKIDWTEIIAWMPLPEPYDNK